jgi:hypothetical protein
LLSRLSVKIPLPALEHGSDELELGAEELLLGATLDELSGAEELLSAQD